MTAQQYTAEFSIDGGQCGETTRQIEAESLDAAWEQAKAEAEAWAEAGDWGHDGAMVEVHITIDDVTDSIEVSIEPDHEHLMEKAGAPEDCEHEWTADESDGGCRENPGVWSKGGTTIVVRTHCEHCGLIRIETQYGSQRNPGQHDTVQYRMPE